MPRLAGAVSGVSAARGAGDDESVRSAAALVNFRVDDDDDVVAVVVAGSFPNFFSASFIDATRERYI